HAPRAAARGPAGGRQGRDPAHQHESAAEVAADRAADPAARGRGRAVAGLPDDAAPRSGALVGGRRRARRLGEARAGRERARRSCPLRRSGMGSPRSDDAAEAAAARSCRGPSPRESGAAMAVSDATATPVRPFTVAVADGDLDHLRRRIAATRWPEHETVSDQTQGVQLATMQALIHYWGTEYDLRRFETRLNAFPQFVTEIDSLD